MQNEMVETFTAKAKAVSAEVRHIKSMQEAFDYTVNICVDKEACQFLMAGCELPVSDEAQQLCEIKPGEKVIAAPALDDKNLSGLTSQAEKQGITTITSELRRYLGGIDIGLAVADLGLAETGTLVLKSASEDLRLATMICEINVMVLPLSRMRQGSYDAEKELSEMLRDGANYLSFITGASRTADIERVLALGVHGPLELHILLLEDA
ncbi:protein of unknown function DUF162 [Desulfonatronospira thiodismutans ASO3-1]|uniref:LUD domain-containing protein n=1 Tax=Desulfonatronospira thiodismutans ASO3-1 TaxID=555779 RepID=D6SLE8_9BACT|nr:lactate utilization protein [Desulfonatronospira thiodismutans]EFI35509.1 protein of unknown function DUF162 [Desulfonatronospira thiodismutans ASO3-1]